MDATASKRGDPPPTSGFARILDQASVFTHRLNPAHKKTPQWKALDRGQVRIDQAIALAKGFRPQSFTSNSAPLPKKCDLNFYAETTVSKPYKVYWQIVNTGQEAETAGSLRGGFDEGGIVSKGRLKRRESTLYTGTHSIECFIVKDGYLTARSGQFIVNIK